MSQEKVSIIITNYKKEKLLKKAIMSCLSQGHSNLEVIVVDDCSDIAACKKIIKQISDKRVRLISVSKNYGHYMCCNYALDKATGRFVTFLGGDDFLEKNHISSLLKPLLKKAAQVASMCMYIRQDAGGGLKGAKKICEASLFFERARVLSDIGYFHPARFGADSEFRERLKAYYGPDSIFNTKKLTYKSLQLPGSLTTAPASRSGSKHRAFYAKRFRKNIKENPKNCFFDYKTDKLPFSVGPNNETCEFNIKFFKEIKLW